ncbi:MAG: MFS transporter [Gemmatimonadetes bacterium]|nr:MFS transporter [Gemmatimonadota bacterium]MYF74104.1 MFS transporter [Gemmatimonadota bacterium]MYK50422.1 MFS transporter [Gemmatimonadota bacterium]
MQYDKNRFKIRAIPHPLVLHWILNPGLIFNELILGQRIPKVMLIDEESDKPLMERTYVPCPHCETLNDSRLWAKRNSFGHWFGFLCPNCHQIIPCLWNIFSLAILAITFPLWYFPARFYRHRWIEKEKERLANVLERPLIQAKTVDWLFRGIVYWGGSMWLILEILPQMWKVLHGNEWDLPKMFAMLSIWLIAGFAWGLIMRSWMNRKR